VISVQRWRRLLPGLWAGWLLCVALLATPAPFATLAPADAGRVAARMLAEDAYVGLALGVVLLLLERAQARRSGGSQFTPGVGLVLGAIFCVVAGYFAVLPMMASARAGQGPLSFGQLHAVSMAFFGLKLALVAALAWRSAFSPPTAS
jgi:hypothetical protein